MTTTETRARVRRWSSFAVLAAVLLFAGEAAAASPSGRLVYSRAPAAASCPDEATLRRAVSARVGYDPFFPWAKRTIVVAFARRGREFVAAVSLVDEGGVAHGGRELRTRGDCADLRDPAALAIAIAIDPTILARPPAPPPAEPAFEAAPPGVAPPPREVAPVAVAHPLATAPRLPSPPPPVVLEASLGAILSNGQAPDLAVGTTAGAQIRKGGWSLGLEAQLDASASRSARGGGEVSALLLTGAVVPCAYLGALMACAVGQGGGTKGASEGVPGPRARWAGTFQAGGRLGVLAPVAGNLSLRVHSDLLANLDRVRLDLRGAAVWVAAPVSSSLGFDLVLRFR